MNLRSQPQAGALLTACCLALACPALAADTAVVEPPDATKTAAEKKQTVELARGALKVSTPAAWKKVKPRNRIIEVELAVPGKAASEGSASKDSTKKDSTKKDSTKKGSTTKGSGAKPAAKTARLTIMAAGGSVDQNLDRWVGQFQGTTAGAAREKGKIEHREAAGMPLHTLDIAGTFMDAMRGPFGPKTAKPDHRMLAGILETKNHGNYFFKLVGPADVVGPNAKAFAAMLDSVEAK